jgi:hypothetical protein
MLIVRLMDIFNAYLIFLMNNIFYIFLTQIKNKLNFVNRHIQYLMDMVKREL